MDLSVSDIVFLVLVIWTVMEILNNGDWGGGHRARIDNRVPVPI